MQIAFAAKLQNRSMQPLPFRSTTGIILTPSRAFNRLLSGGAELRQASFLGFRVPGYQSGQDLRGLVAAAQAILGLTGFQQGCGRGRRAWKFLRHALKQFQRILKQTGRKMGLASSNRRLRRPCTRGVLLDTSSNPLIAWE